MDDKSILDDILSGQGISPLPLNDLSQPTVDASTASNSSGLTYLTEGVAHETRSESGVSYEVFSEKNEDKK